ncbi:hypothetical protein SAMN03159488_01499 [Pseudomonas sp. NFIX10]|nr:hypothetical protein SAMN03159488_01499 [Pseudomonas sp. NFIX10]SFE56846.1 hypothetical protein SAMN03159367_01499 [Pseudomonas sp. NFACC06-1]
MRSLYRVSQSGGTTYFDADESGFDELARIHERVLEQCDASQVLYLDSDEDLMGDTRSTLARFCDFAGIDFSPRLLSWAPEKVEQWQFFQGWHDDAERSCGFAKSRTRKSPSRKPSNPRRGTNSPSTSFFT